MPAKPIFTALKSIFGYCDSGGDCQKCHCSQWGTYSATNPVALVPDLSIRQFVFCVLRSRTTAMGFVAERMPHCELPIWFFNIRRSFLWQKTATLADCHCNRCHCNACWKYWTFSLFGVVADDGLVGGEEDVLAHGAHERLVEAARRPRVRRPVGVRVDVGAEFGRVCLVPPKISNW